MATNTVTNWFGNIVSHPTVIVDAHSVDDIIDVMKCRTRQPYGPGRAMHLDMAKALEAENF